MKDVWYIDQVEFKRLQEQVRDVSMNLKNKFRTSAYQVCRILIKLFENITKVMKLIYYKIQIFVRYRVPFCP